MFFVYAIKSKRNGRIYIGQTKKVDARLLSHNKGHVRSTKKDRPWELVSVEGFGTREEARWFEHELKGSLGKRRRWLEKHLAGIENRESGHGKSECQE